MLDYKKIKEDSDAREVIKYLSVPYLEKNGKFLIHCPGHKLRLGKDDKHLGNCIVSKKGYYCFACGQFVSTPDMIKELLGCDYKESYDLMASILGGDYEKGGNVFIPLLSEEDKEVLEIDSSFNTNDEFISLIEMEKKDSRTFKIKIKELIRDKIDHYHDLIVFLDTKEGEDKCMKLRGNMFSYEDVESAREYATQKIGKLNNLLKKVSF